MQLLNHFANEVIRSQQDTPSKLIPHAHATAPAHMFPEVCSDLSSLITKLCQDPVR